ncbi:hypothetical protein BCB4_0055 [Bacillus phage B4]|uniref:Uncharacterized protein n=2 Tax=Bequatrovirus B4 TaxID=1918005 RepID=J9PQG6_9CAUD|nr:hypothetical protein BCB4_0055 [Bacillus phage B4]YP_009783650.1 hypothetical protein QLX26_gp054 [Bacillus phage B5S]AEW47288.1 hypothetical protein B5S_0054 [Bacillus phage B5S]AEZ65848.1 hypothetical protein BCB4_0055 [Bacillus phage B4]
MAIVFLITIVFAFIWSTYKLFDGFSHIRKYTVGRFMLHAVICATTGVALIIHIAFWFVERL